MKLKRLAILLPLIGICIVLLSHCALPIVEASQLPATVKFAVDPPTDSPAGYNVSQDGGAVTFVPLPTPGTCNDFFTNTASPCVEFPFTFTTAGAHTITVASTSVGGTSTSVSLAFNLSVPGTPSHGHIVK